MSKFSATDAIEVICQKLAERTANLFTGAGINAGLVNKDGVPCPLGSQLSSLIAKDLLQDQSLSLPLDEASEIAESKVGRLALNDYVSTLFSTFTPGIAHYSIAQLPWDTIYTTNYDVLIEQAASSNTIESAGLISPVLSRHTELSLFSEEDILYYKLHGSITEASSPSGRLILTKEDYRYYEKERKPLFRRLLKDLARRTFVFVGYSLTDSNIRALLSDCREELGIESFPLSFAIRPSFSPVEETFWRDKYNLQLISADAGDFLSDLAATWGHQARVSLTPSERAQHRYVELEDSSSFERVGSSFYFVSPQDISGTSNPKRFYKGGEASWADVRDGVAPRREVYWTMMETMFPELVDAALPVSIYLVTGAAGTGKSTLVRQIAFDLAKDYQVNVWSYIPGTPLDHRVIGPYVDKDDPSRIVILFESASEIIPELKQFIYEVKHRQYPITIILEERRNQWSSATEDTKGIFSLSATFEVGILQDAEIKSILDALTRFDCLGKLTDHGRDYQESHFRDLAQKELLIALRELTSGTDFDKIVLDEFHGIPSSIGRRAYLFVSALGQIGLNIRYETLQHILGLQWSEFSALVFRPTVGVLISAEDTGYSRHNEGFRVRVRHPIIGSIIFGSAAPDDESKIDILRRLIVNLDVGHFEDRKLLHAIVRRRELVSTLSLVESRREVYDMLERILPNNPYVFQHRSILEREMQNAEEAVRFAKMAVRIEKSNVVFQNTLGLALEFSSRFINDPIKKRSLISEAARIFRAALARNSSDPYAHLGIFYVARHEIESEMNPSRRAVLEGQALADLELAYEASDESNVIGVELAKFKNELGSSEEAEAMLMNALKYDPINARIRDRLILLLSESGRFEAAGKYAEEGLKLDPTSYRLHRQMARLGRSLKASPASIIGHYDAAIRHHMGDIGLLVEAGSYLFMQGNIEAAQTRFDQSKKVKVENFEYLKIREWWLDESGRRQVFNGRVDSLSPSSGKVLVMPRGFEAFFWKNSLAETDIRINSMVSVLIGFNAYGPIARGANR